LKRLKNHWEDNRKTVLEKTSIDAIRTGSAELDEHLLLPFSGLQELHREKRRVLMQGG